MPIDYESDDHDALISAIDAMLNELHFAADEASAQITALGKEQEKLGYHPNTIAYRHGGLLAAHGGTAAHILSHAGFYRLEWRTAIKRLSDARSRDNGDCLLSALLSICETDPMLEVAGLAWLDDEGLLKRGVINPFWINRPKLGLGQPAKQHGLTVEDANAHRGLYTLSPFDLHRRFGAVSSSDDAKFGDMLPLVIAAGGAALAEIGARAIERDAAQRYWADCARFAAHQRANGDRRWRWKPPLSNQGHHAITIANLNGTPLPTARTRGHAANWLSENGANPRFTKDRRS